MMYLLYHRWLRETYSSPRQYKDIRRPWRPQGAGCRGELGYFFEGLGSFCRLVLDDGTRKHQSIPAAMPSRSRIPGE